MNAKTAIITAMMVGGLATPSVLAETHAFDTAGGKYAYAYPYYVVNVEAPAAITLKALDAITKVEEGGAESVLTFDEFHAVTSGTFFKTGLGELEMADTIENFGGQIHVMAGVLKAGKNNSLGKQVVGADNYPAASAAVYVHSGATLYAAPAGNEQSCADWKKMIVHEGTGAEGYGGSLYSQPTGSGENTWSLNFLTALSGDATFVGNYPGSIFKMSWSPNPGQKLDLAGHTLAFSGLTKRSGNAGNMVTFTQNGATVTPGHLVFSNVTFLIYGTPTFKGDSNSTARLTHGSGFHFNGGVTSTAGTPWTLIVDDAAFFTSTLGTAANDPKGETAEKGLYPLNRLGWGGPVVLNGDINVLNDSPNSVWKTMTFMGDISGQGGIHPYSAHYGRKMHLRLAGTNTFEGGIGLSEGYLHLHSAKALPMANDACFTNSSMVLYADEQYEMPTLRFDGTNKVYTSAGLGEASAQKIVKTGDGELFISSFLNSGTLELLGGSVKMPNVFAGALEGLRFKSGGAASYFESDRQLPANRQALAMNLGNDGWPKSTCLTYGAWLWNRSATNETWSFVTRIGNGYIMYFDTLPEEGIATAKRVIDSRPWNSVETEPGKDHYQLFTTNGVTPGPHWVEFRYYSAAGSDATPIWPAATMKLYDTQAKQVLEIESENGRWEQYKALVWCRGFSRNPADYSEIADPGDGSVMTYTTNFTVDVFNRLKPFSSITAAAGTMFDANHGCYTTATLTGGMAVTNADIFTVSTAWNIDREFLLAGGQLATKGRLVFSPGCALNVTGLSTMHSGAYTVAVAEGGIEGCPTFDRAAPGVGKWHFRKSADEKTLTLEYLAGTTLIIR